MTSVGITGYCIAELRAGVVMARWGEGERWQKCAAPFAECGSALAGPSNGRMPGLPHALPQWRVRETDRDTFESGPLLLSESPSRSLSLRACGVADEGFPTPGNWNVAC